MPDGMAAAVRMFSVLSGEDGVVNMVLLNPNTTESCKRSASYKVGNPLVPKCNTRLYTFEEN